jgi:hypothetical protein
MIKEMEKIENLFTSEELAKFMFNYRFNSKYVKKKFKFTVIYNLSAIYKLISVYKNSFS